MPLISLTGVGESTLARAATVSLVLPKVREACPHNLAPTTSTLLQLAMGDALAVALLQKKGFGAESFHGFHPGGSLGAQLRHLDEVMHGAEALPLVDVAAPVIAAERSEQRKVVTVATSDCVPYWFGLLERRSPLSGSMAPGQTEFTRILCSRRASAIAPLRPISPAFAAQ